MRNDEGGMLLSCCHFGSQGYQAEQQEVVLLTTVQHWNGGVSLRPPVG